jgi:hypothetical protein
MALVQKTMRIEPRMKETVKNIFVFSKLLRCTLVRLAASFKTPKCPKRYSQWFKELLGYYNRKLVLSTMLQRWEDV